MKLNRLAVHAALLAVSVLLVAVSPAAAHGLGAQDPNRPLEEYLWLGFKHLLAGWDHLLFILAIVLLAGGLWRATKLISLFVAGHSITLMLATTQEWTVSPQIVDVVIALSVLFVAVVGLRGRPKTWTRFGGALFAIGLVHGLGLATRLLELGVADNGLAWRVLLFNIGVELGQAVAFVGAGALLVRLKATRKLAAARVRGTRCRGSDRRRDPGAAQRRDARPVRADQRRLHPAADRRPGRQRRRASAPAVL